MTILVGHRNSLLTRENRIDLVSPIADTLDDLLFGSDGFGGCELPRRRVVLAVNDLELARGKTGVEIAFDLGIPDLAHAATEAVADQGALVYDRLALEVLVASEGQRLAHVVDGVRRLLLML